MYRMLTPATCCRGIEKMGSARMSQGMDGHAALVDSGIGTGFSHGAANTVAGHGLFSGVPVFSATGKSRENQLGISVSLPVFSKQFKGVRGYRDDSILGSLAPVDMDLHSIFIDIGYLDMEPLPESQTQRVNGEKIRVIMKSSDFGKKTENLLPAQNAWQAFFRLGLEYFEEMPVFFQDIQIEKLDPAIAYFQRARGPFIIIALVEKIIFQLLFGDQGRFLAVKFDQLSHGPSVHVLRCVTFSGELKSPDGFRVPFCLDTFSDGFGCGDAFGILVFTGFLLHDNTPFLE